MGKRGPVHQPIVEMEMEAGTTDGVLKGLIEEFLAKQIVWSLAKRNY